jgi:hypothetical protein
MIYVPREVISLLALKIRRGENSNPCVCTKMKYKGYEISISSDASHGAGDLFRTDIRVYTDPGAAPQVDVTELFLAEGETMLYGDVETLYRVLDTINKFDEQSHRDDFLPNILAG